MYGDSRPLRSLFYVRLHDINNILGIKVFKVLNSFHVYRIQAYVKLVYIDRTNPPLCSLCLRSRS